MNPPRDTNLSIEVTTTFSIQYSTDTQASQNMSHNCDQHKP